MAENETPVADQVPAAPPEAPASPAAEEPTAPVEVGPAPAPLAAPAPEPAPVVPSPVLMEELAEGPEEEPEADELVPAAAPAAEAPPEQKKKWYAVKVQSNREDTIKEAIERRVKKEGLEEYYGQIVIPVEKYTEVKQDKNGRKVTRTKERKLYAGYLFVELEYNDKMLYLFRETSGVGDFVGSNPHKLDRAPTPMSDVEVKRIIGGGKVPDGEQRDDVPLPPKGLGVGDRVKVVDGIFNGQEGIIKQVLETVGKFQVEVTIFGRPVSVDVEYYQVEEI